MTAPTTMAMPVEVDAPSIERYPFGLLSAARIQTAPDLRWEAFGVNYVADSCGPSGGVWPNPCDRLNPGPATVYTAQIEKPGGSDNVYVTLIANAYGPRVPVTVTVGTADPQDLLVGQRSDAVEVTESTTVTITAAIPATGDYPACSNDVDAAIPATADSYTTTLTCTATIPDSAELTKTIDSGLTLVSGSSFIAYEGMSCATLTVDEATTRAQNRLALHEQYWVERQVDIGLLRQDVVLLNGGTATGMVHGIGLLEQAIAQRYGGIGVIHAARELAASLTFRALVRRDGARLRSPLDNLYAFGSGYSTTGPDGTDAPAGQAWLYATGPVVVRRGEVQNREAFDQRRNTRMALAERSYAVTADCLRVAVLTEIPEA